MLRNLKDLKGRELMAEDGNIGRSTDVLIDDRRWTVRYLVADTRTWLPGRKVVIAPDFLGDLPVGLGRLPVGLTKEQIEQSPELDEHEPVSARRETEVVAFTGVAPMWLVPVPVREAVRRRAERTSQVAKGGDSAVATMVEPAESDVRLRSLHEIEGYRIAARDDEVGHVEDLLADTDDWTIRYLVVDTRNWLPGRKVLISPEWVEEFDWARREASIDLTRAQIEASPEYEPTGPIPRAYEARLHDAYGRSPYWS